MARWFFRRRLWVSAILATLAASWGCGLFFFSEGPPDFYVFKANAERVSLPPQTSLIDRDAGYGLQIGNGNHCDYIARLLLRTELGEAGLKEYYRHHTLADVRGSYSSEPTGAEILTLSDYPYSYDFPERWQRYAKDRNVFVVQYFDSSEPGFDPRCH